MQEDSQHYSNPPIFNNVYYDVEEKKMYYRKVISGEIQSSIFYDYGFVRVGDRISPRSSSSPNASQYQEFIGGHLLEKTYQYSSSSSNNNRWDYYYDISAERKFLLDYYVNSSKDNAFQVYSHINIAYIDIEVDEKEGMKSIKEFNSEITAVSIIVDNKRKKTMICGIFFVCNTDNTKNTDISVQVKKQVKDSFQEEGLLEEIRDNILIVPAISERELLKKVCLFFEKTSPEFISGWNIEEFDIPYILNRIKKLFSKEESALLLSKLSPYKKTTITRNGRSVIPGLSIMDEMKLYKKYYSSTEKSFSLNNIAKKVLKKEKAIEKNQTIGSLRRDNFLQFIYYNFYDTLLVFLIEKKVQVIETAVELCYETNTLYRDVYYSSVIIDNAILTRLLPEKKIPPATRRKGIVDEDFKFEGAFVKEPQRGLFEWVFDLDVESLYPNIIVGLNISPETKIQVLSNESEQEDILIKRRKQFLDAGYCISKNNVIYCSYKEKRGVIPQLVLSWIEKRKKYKSLMKTPGLKEEEKNFYNKKQLIQKILVNSVYGVLGLPTFRFYDIDNCQAVTLTGQVIVQKGMEYGNKLLNETVKEKTSGITLLNTDYCLYSDTDSLFFKIDDSLISGEEEEDKKKKIVFEVSARVMDYVNEQVNEFFNVNFNFEKGRIFFKREFISKTALFFEKKHYAQWLIDQEGMAIDKIDFKGVEAIKSNYPEVFSNKIQTLITLILKKASEVEICEFLENFNQSLKLPISERGQLLIYTSAGDIEKFSNPINEVLTVKQAYKKSTPIHIKAAIIYNYLLSKLSQKKSSSVDILLEETALPYYPIKSGDKIKYGYVKTPNKLGIECLAIPIENPEPTIERFLLEQLDVDKMKYNFFDSKLDKILSIANINLNNNTFTLF